MIIHHIVHHLGIGGAERLVSELALAQAQLGDQVVLLLLADRHPALESARLERERAAVLTDAGVEIHLLGAGSRSALGNAMRYRNRMRSGLSRPDVVHTHTPIGAPIAKFAGVAHVHLTLHSTGFSVPTPWIRILALWADSLSSGSEAVAQRLSTSMGRDVMAVPYGLNIRHQRPAASEEMRNGVRILFVGRLERQKRPERFVHVIRDVVGQGSSSKWEIEVRIIGDGEQREDIAKLVHELGLAENVRLLGAVTDLQEHFEWADVLASTSDYEGIPLVILEALGRETPVIATPFDGALEFERKGYPVLTAADFSVEAMSTLLSSVCRDLQGGSKATPISPGRSAIPTADDMAQGFREVYGGYIELR